MGDLGRSEELFLNLIVELEGTTKCVGVFSVGGLLSDKVTAGLAQVASNPPRAAMASDADCDRNFRLRRPVLAGKWPSGQLTIWPSICDHVSRDEVLPRSDSDI